MAAVKTKPKRVVRIQSSCREFRFKAVGDKKVAVSLSFDYEDYDFSLDQIRKLHSLFGDIVEEADLGTTCIIEERP